MFTSDFLYKMEEAGVKVKTHIGIGVDMFMLYDGEGESVGTISIGGHRYMDIYDAVFGLEKPEYVIDTIAEYHKTPYDEREDKRYLLYFVDISGKFKLIRKHYSSVLSGYYFSTRENNFDSFVDMLEFVSHSSIENFSRLAISREEIKQLPDSWKPKEFGGNDVTQCIEVKYWKDDK